MQNSGDGRLRHASLLLVLGVGCLVATFFFGGLSLPIIGTAFTLGGLLLLLADRYLSDPRVGVAIGVTTFALPGVLYVGLGVLTDAPLVLASGVFLLGFVAIILLQATTSVDTERLLPILYGVFAAVALLLDYVLVATVMVGFALFFGYRAVRPTATPQ